MDMSKDILADCTYGQVADNLDKIRKAGEGAYALATTVGPLLFAVATR